MESYAYENLPEDTKVFFNKAMDIYSIMKSKYIEYFTELDKRILSLLAASFLIDGELKHIVSSFSDLSYEKVLQFMELTEDEIKPLDGDYATFYDENFKNDLQEMELKNIDKMDYEKTPVVIFSYFNHLLVIGSGVLNSFANFCELDSALFNDHPIFSTIEKRIQDKKVDESRWQSLYRSLDMSRETDSGEERNSFFGSGSPKVPPISVPAFASRPNMNSEKQPEEINKEEEEEQKRLDELAYWESEEIWGILDEITAKFIGQEQLVEDLFYNIVNNQRMILKGELQDGQRSIIFIDGPTGTGKTAIIREITNRLNLPFHRSAITKYSPTGYQGGDIESTLEQLLKQSDRDLVKAERGIVAFDEFDKLVYNPSTGNSLESKKGVQQELLDFMGGGTYKVPMMQTLFGSISAEFDTSKLTFICLGALTDLREKKSTPNKSIGFNSDQGESKKDSYEINPNDLIDLGYERELVGRLNTYLHTEEYSKEDFLRILKESTISPMKGLIDWVSSYNKELVIADDVYETIAEAAYDFKFGVRGIQKVINDVRTFFLRQVMRSNDSTIYLDVETVNRACKKAVTRKSGR